MSCKYIKEYPLLYVYKELDDNERFAFQEHLETCKSCQRAVDELKETLGTYRSLEPESIDENHIRVLVDSAPTVQPHIKQQSFLYQLLSKLRTAGLHPVWSPALAGLAVVIILFAVWSPVPDSDLNPNSGINTLAWNTGVDDSLEYLEDQIDDIQVPNADQELDDYGDLVLGIVKSQTEQQLDRIEQEIYNLSRELSLTSF